MVIEKFMRTKAQVLKTPIDKVFELVFFEFLYRYMYILLFATFYLVKYIAILYYSLFYIILYTYMWWSKLFYTL